jgi:hypothetical protein
MTTLHNVIAVVPSCTNSDYDRDDRIACRAEHIEDEIKAMTVADLRDALQPCDRIRLDELISDRAYTLALNEESRYD